MRKHLEDMTEPELRETMKACGQAIESASNHHQRNPVRVALHYVPRSTHPTHFEFPNHTE